MSAAGPAGSRHDVPHLARGYTADLMLTPEELLSVCGW